MPTLLMLVGPPGSGKSTKSKEFIAHDAAHGANLVYVNQDSQGKFQHMEVFREALRNRENIVVDRMNFNKAQRNGYLEQAKKAGYYTVIHVVHESYEVCMKRMMARKDHETIKDYENAKQALNFFFKSYERVEDWEADEVHRHWPEMHYRPPAVVCDLDGTLCDINHRRHHVRKTDGSKKDWVAFMKGIPDDNLNLWCKNILDRMKQDHCIVLCSGRGETERALTTEWLEKFRISYDHLFMRQAGDSRQDAIVKEIILDFEILTRFRPEFMIDDRQQVVDMWRKRGFVCLQCDKGDF